MRLLIGPPRSGKTRHCLDELRAALRARHGNCRLLVPTSTMAEHLRNTLAREGLVFSPKCVDTFGHFVDSLTPAVRQATSGTVAIFTGRYLDKLAEGPYAPVRSLPGFRRMLASAIESFAGAGGDEISLGATHPAFQDAYRSVFASVRAAGYTLRPDRLRSAAAKLREDDVPLAAVWMVGFSGFTGSEADVLRALDERTALTVSLSQSPLGQRTREVLAPLASEIRTFPARPSIAKSVIVACSTPENEAAEIARRILVGHERGRKLRDTVVVLRTEASAATLRGVFARFGIPSQFHLGQPLPETTPVRFVNALLDAAASGWDYAASVTAFRMYGSPLERTGDSWEYEVRRKLPGKGLEFLRSIAPEWCDGWFAELADLGSNVGGQHTPEQWSAQLVRWTKLFRPGGVRDGATAEQIEVWRNNASALAQFCECAAEAAATFPGAEPISLREFRAAVETALQSASLWPRDRRSDVVHVVDAAEARHWRAPVVFVCGLIEDEFPRRVNEDAVLPDRDRLRLAQAGVFMPTSSQRQAEEHFLFDTAASIASEQTVFTYPALSSKGDPLTASFALARIPDAAREHPVLVRPQPERPRAAEPAGPVISTELLQHLSGRYAKLSPSAIEGYVHCPWAFFAQRTLGLEDKPEDIWERLHLRAQGDIAHKAAELHFKEGLPVEEALEQAFQQVRQELNIPYGYRTEAIWLELRHNVRRLLADECAQPDGARILFEHPFEFRIGDVELRGKMDRVDIDAAGRAIVFDYKYSRPDRLRDVAKANDEGEKVQGGLYLRAVREMGFQPAGLVWIGFKNSVEHRGWVVPPLRPDLKSSCSPDYLEELVATALDTTLRVAREIASGVVSPAPADEDNCERCDFKHVCRFEVGARKRAIAAANGGAGHATE